MTFSSDPKSTMPTGLKIGLGILAGCGCLSVGTVVLGIIAAIALPSLLNQSNPIKASEAKTYLGTMNRANQAHFLEHGEFTDSLTALQLDLSPETEAYRYLIQRPTWGPPSAIATAIPQNNQGFAMTGAVFAVPVEDDVSGQSEWVTIAILCQSLEPGTAPLASPAPPLSIEQPVSCPPGSKSI